MQTDISPMEAFVGRSLAFCVHPCAAWRRLAVGGRTLLVAAYFAAAYSVVLTILFTL